MTKPNRKTPNKAGEKMAKCIDCNGDGFTAEHDPRDPHENGCNNCPIQVECETCEATGKITLRQKNKITEERQKALSQTSNDMPF